jgi:hypothetical protein
MARDETPVRGRVEEDDIMPVQVVCTEHDATPCERIENVIANLAGA